MGLVPIPLKYWSSTWIKYHSRPEVQIRDLAMLVRRRQWWPRLIRKIIGGGEGHWKRYQSSL